MYLNETESVTISLVSGGFAGLVCSIILYPVDTATTRLQSEGGFFKTGGFRGIYRGIGSVVLGSVPHASSYFIAYDTSKVILPKVISSSASVHMLSGCIAELFSALLCMPFEVVKQTAQAGGNLSSRAAFTYVMKNNGFSGLYSGFFSTMCRDVPSSAMLMPIWEYLKLKVGQYNESEVSAFQSGICGCIGAGIAAAVTTPLDVAKTRIILSQKVTTRHTENPFRAILQIYRQEGALKLFSGITPRVLGISAGGFIFFAAYDEARSVCNDYFSTFDI